MAAVLLVRRRRPSVVLARGRGASGRVLFVASLLESVLVTALASLAGFGLAVALEPGAKLEPSLLGAIAIGILSIVVLVAAAWPPIRQPLADLERSVRPVRRFDPRRLVAELTVIALALVGAYVLRQRGAATASVGLDPFLAAVPPLIGLAVGIATIRLYPPTISVAGWLADRRRDLVPALGIRAVARGGTSSLPALVMVLAIAFAAFTGVVSASVDSAQRTASWLTVGADVRVEPGDDQGERLPEVDFGAIPGVEASAQAYVDRQARAPAGTRAGTIVVHAIETAAYAQVVAGSPVEPRWPQPLLSAPGDGPIPAIVGSRLAGEELGLRQGDTFQLTILGRQLEMQAVEVRPGLAGVTTGDSFVIVPYSWLREVAGQQVRPSVAWLRAPASVLPAIAEHPAAQAGQIAVASRYETYARLRDQPVIGAIGVAFSLAFAVSVVYAVLTILGAVVLSAGRRTRDLAILRTLGLNQRQATRLTLVEHLPPLLVALPVGIALGIGVAVAVAPAMNLGALSGSSGDIPLIVDWPVLAAVSAALALLAFAAVIIGGWLSRREAIGNALRMASD
jgi:putative ABC transport system permease protein